MKLTDTKIRAAKPRDKAYQLQDGNGLYLDIRPSGAKTWRYRYWLTPTKDGRYTIGDYPQISLSDARKAREWARSQVKAGITPKQARAAEDQLQRSENANSFEIVALEWMGKKWDKWSPTYRTKLKAAFELNVFPVIGARPMRSIVAADILSIMREIEGRGAATQATKVRIWCSAVFCYGVATLRADSDPAAALKQAIIEPKTDGARPLSVEELQDYLRRTASYPGRRITRLALQLLPLLFVRQYELRSAEWSEISLEDAIWVIPGRKMKKRTPHHVPLSSAAMRVFRELKEITGNSKWVFPGDRDPQKFMGSTTLNEAIVRLGYEVGQTTTHDFRATASTFLHEWGYHSDAIERQLAHIERKKVKAVYNHAKYLPERKELMEVWGQWITDLLADPPRYGCQSRLGSQ
ncbi:tyrosine-type recombinase/integrase [Serratia quinivorans]|uniref:tyrosine-type recombinase/integrase n=1 Tax=Serratia quinivorans TaxID=137545 RepID=UPI0021B7BD5A|nr:integrase arm-type DNA-binding domain-containing protein [Serratia quinivorans]